MKTWGYDEALPSSSIPSLTARLPGFVPPWAQSSTPLTVTLFSKYEWPTYFRNKHHFLHNFPPQNANFQGNIRVTQCNSSFHNDKQVPKCLCPLGQGSSSSLRSPNKRRPGESCLDYRLYPGSFLKQILPAHTTCSKNRWTETERLFKSKFWLPFSHPRYISLISVYLFASMLIESWLCMLRTASAPL